MRNRVYLAIVLLACLLSGCVWAASGTQPLSDPTVATGPSESWVSVPEETTAATQAAPEEHPVTLEQEQEAQPWYLCNCLIRHACGSIGTLAYTNSKEAMENSLETGNRLIEVDFLLTTDGHLVCAHKWRDIFSNGKAGTLESFLKRDIPKYTQLTASNILGYMQEYPDLYIVVDTKEKDLCQVVSLLVELASDPDTIERLIIQTYWPGEKEKLMELYPFPRENILFTAYKFGEERIPEILQLCLDEDIPVVTTPWNRWDQETVAEFSRAGIVVFEHTVNTTDDLSDSLNRGVHGIYTDSLQWEDWPTLEAADGQ